MITITPINDETFEVSIAADRPTTHRATLTQAYVQQITQGKHSPEQLLIKSFEFLLAREPNTSILRQFDLPMIGRYFAEYEDTIKRMLSKRS